MDMSMILLVGKSVGLLCLGGLVSLVSVVVVYGGWKCITKCRCLRAESGLRSEIWRPYVADVTKTDMENGRKVLHVGNGKGF